MAEGEFEPELQIAIQLLRCLNPQNQQLSRLILQHLPFLGTKFHRPPTDNMGLVSSSRAGMVLPHSGNMGVGIIGSAPYLFYPIIPSGKFQRPT